MGIPEQSDENIAEYIAKRKVSRATLQKIMALGASWVEEERQRVALIKVLNKTLPIWIIVVVAMFFFLVDAFTSHSKMQFFAAFIVIGIFCAIVLILWNSRDGKN